MASIENRSRYLVRIPRRPQHDRDFPYYARAAALQYVAVLEKQQRMMAELTQLEDRLLVRIRLKGHPPQCLKADSYDAAEQLILKFEADSRRGLFIDYARGRSVTFAQLIVRYLKEECEQHKGKKVERYTLQGMLADSRNELATALKKREELARGGIAEPDVIRARRQPRSGLEWFHKPFGDLVPEDIHRFRDARLKQVAKSTVDRELDLISAVINIAIHTWRYPVQQSPMDGVRRPKYFNERDRRLGDDEEIRLFEVAREEDRLRSLDLALAPLLAPARAHARGLPNASARKRHIAAARKSAEDKLRGALTVEPIYECFISFLLETAARRSEALALRWEDLNLEDQTAFFPDTKNGRSRKSPVQRASCRLLAMLTRKGEYVFPLTVDQIKGAWSRIRARADLKDYRMHDLRHEALSRIAEAGHASGQHFTLIDLATISGHRDLRSLARYSNLIAKHLARRIDEAFDRARARRGEHRGRRRLGGNEGISVQEVLLGDVEPKNIGSNLENPNCGSGGVTAISEHPRFRQVRR